MQHKRWVCALTAAALLSAGVPARALTGVSDWAKAGVTEADDQALLPDNFESLRAAEPVTRQEFCGVLVRLYGAATLINVGFAADDPEIGSGSPFTDTDDPAVIAANYLGLVSGRGNGRFDPRATITRQELCVMLSNLTRIRTETTESADQTVLDDFPDRDDVAAWAADDMAGIVGAGVMSGTVRADGTVALDPLGNATREQAVLLALRYLEAYPPQAAPVFGAEDDWDLPMDDDLDGEDLFTSEFFDGIYFPDFGALSQAEKMALVFGAGGTLFDDKDTAEAAMTEICVPVWRLQSDGTKVSGKQYLTVNRTLAVTVTEIFEEIFNGPERFPIKNAGGFSWRSNTRSEHRQGTAIDINWEENMECNIDPATGEVLQITTGTHWTPGEDPYSIPASGDVVRAFKSHGFAWGGDAWKSKRDYMHFSFFGR